MTFKQLTLRLVFPLTIICFGIFTKWWYVLPEDAPDTMMIGFPFAFVGDGWFTSMSLQIFVLEFFADFISYFLLLVLVVFLIKQAWTMLNVSKGMTRSLWTLAILVTTFWTLILTISEKKFKATRNWDMKILITGFKFTWMHTDRPELSKFNPNHNTPEKNNKPIE